MSTDDRAQIAARAAALIAAQLKPRWTPLPHQIPPDGDWYGWLLLAGRMAGKTDACAAYVHQHVNGPPCLPGPIPHWIAIIGPTQGDAVTSCFSGPSGLSVHSPEAKLVTVKGSTIVRWPNGSEAKIFGTERPDDVDRLRSGGNRCVAEGTLVRTEHGLRPIESIRRGDRVWTRNGLRRVLRTWDNGVKEVQRFEHRAGHVWLTPDHEIWTTRGWTQGRFVKPDDTIVTWENTENLSSPTEFTGISGRTATTRTNTVACCTATCGRKPTAPYRLACTCTTRTTTSRTTEPRTSCCCAPASTGPSTRTSAVPTGTAREAAPPGNARSTAHTTARGAVKSFSPGARPMLGTALPPVEMLRHEHGNNGCAACAATRSNARPVTTPPPVRGGALRSGPTRRGVRVYDLTVEHDHEFFAGDLLVSNCLAWLEELAAWRHLDDAWDHMRFGLRVGPRPHWVASTTPKPKPLIKQLHSGAVANVMLTHASYRDNPHISEDIKASLEERYAGTQLGRQELYGELIDEDENALWQHVMIDEARVRSGDVPDLVRITVGVDPSGGAGEQGIVVVGKSGLVLPGDGGRPQHHGYVLDDRSCQLSPDGWGRRAVQAAIDWEASDLVVERNYGGDMAVATLRAAADALGVDIPIRTVTATRGKAVRAEPVAALTSQMRWHHAGEFPKLEDQMATWYPEAKWSPDRLDAAVWGAWHLKLVGTAVQGQGSLGGGLARKQIVGGRVR